MAKRTLTMRTPGVSKGRRRGRLSVRVGSLPRARKGGGGRKGRAAARIY